MMTYFILLVFSFIGLLFIIYDDDKFNISKSLKLYLYVKLNKIDENKKNSNEYHLILNEINSSNCISEKKSKEIENKIDLLVNK